MSVQLGVNSLLRLPQKWITALPETIIVFADRTTSNGGNHVIYQGNGVPDATQDYLSITMGDSAAYVQAVARNQQAGGSAATLANGIDYVNTPKWFMQTLSANGGTQSISETAGTKSDLAAPPTLSLHDRFCIGGVKTTAATNNIVATLGNGAVVAEVHKFNRVLTAQEFADIRNKVKRPDEIPDWDDGFPLQTRDNLKSIKGTLTLIVEGTITTSATAHPVDRAAFVPDPTGNTPPTFSGPIPNIVGTVGVALTQVDVSAMYTDAGDSKTFSASPAGTAWPAGLVLNATTGIISGTITSVTAANGLMVRNTDSVGQFVDSNPFNVTVTAQVVKGSFVTRKLGNNTASGWPSGTAVNWEWRQSGRIGVAPTSVTYGAGVLAADGTLTIANVPVGAGIALVAKRGATYDLDNVYYQPGTAA